MIQTVRSDGHKSSNKLLEKADVHEPILSLPILNSPTSRKLSENLPPEVRLTYYRGSLGDQLMESLDSSG